MTSPGGVEVGRVSIRVVPDTSKFRQEAKRQLDKIAKSLRIQVLVELDSKKIKAELEKLRKAAQDQTAEMDVEVDGDGARREAGRVKQLIQKTLGAIKTTIGVNIAASVARIRAEMAVINKLVKGYNIRIPMEVVGISKWLAILTAVSGILLSFPHLIGAIGGAVNVVAGALALLPALAAAGVAGIAALAVGLSGFMETLSKAGDGAKFEEALKNLAPNAQSAARALATFREPLHQIRMAVQDELFQGMDKPFLRLKALLPPIKQGMVGISGGIRDMAKDWIAMATSQRSIEDTETIMSNISRGFKEARPSAANFAQTLKDMTVVGSSFLPRLGKATAEVTGEWAEWAQEARETGKLEAMIENMIAKLKQTGRIIGDVVAGFRNIFGALRGGEDFLDIIERITQGFRDWSQLDSTQSTLQSLARVMRVVVDAGTELFGQVFRSAGEVFKDLEPFLITFAQTFATVLADAIRAITPLLKDIARWLSENKAIMVPLAITIISLVTGFKLLATAARGIIAIKNSFLVLKSGAKIIDDVGTGIGKSVKNIATSLWESANNAATWVSTMTSKWREAAAQAVVHSAEVSKAWVKKTAQTAKETAVKWASAAADWIKAWAGAAKAAAVNAAKTAVAWITNIARMVAATVAQMAVAVATWVASWVRMAAVALANAARIALAWLIAMGPIALVIAAVVALVALIILNWDRIKNATKAAWDWIWGHIKRIGSGISSSFQAVVNFVRKIWDECWRVVSDIITGAGEIIRGAVDKIKGFLTGIGDIIGKVIGFFEDIRDGAVEWINKLLTWLKDLGAKILGAIGDLSRLLWDSGRQLVQGLWDGWESYFDDFKSAVVRDGNELVDNVNGVFGIFSPSRVFREIGEYLGKGLIIGMKSQREGILRAGEQMAFSVTNGFGTPMIAVDLVSPIEDATPDVLKAVDNLTTKAETRARGQWNAHLESDEFDPLEDRILAALASGLVVEMDGEKVTKKINKRNHMDARRR